MQICRGHPCEKQVRSFFFFYQEALLLSIDDENTFTLVIIELDVHITTVQSRFCVDLKFLK